MASLLIVIGELVILFFISKKVTQSLFMLLYQLTRSRSFSISVLTLILFPGTVVHELAHLFTAEVLGVRTGKLTLTPESIRGAEVQAGSVAIASTGPFRKTLISFAPLVWGLTAIGALSYFLYNPPLLPSSLNPLYYQILLFYLLFSVSNTLFPSSLDLKGTSAPIITVVFLLVASYVAGLKISLTGQSLVFFTELFDSLARNVGIVLAVNIALLLIVYILLVLVGKLTRWS